MGNSSILDFCEIDLNSLDGKVKNFYNMSISSMMCKMSLLFFTKSLTLMDNGEDLKEGEYVFTLEKFESNNFYRILIFEINTISKTKIDLKLVNRYSYSQGWLVQPASGYDTAIETLFSSMDSRMTLSMLNSDKRF